MSSAIDEPWASMKFRSAVLSSELIQRHSVKRDIS